MGVSLCSSCPPSGSSSSLPLELAYFESSLLRNALVKGDVKPIVPNVPKVLGTKTSVVSRTGDDVREFASDGVSAWSFIVDVTSAPRVNGWLRVVETEDTDLRSAPVLVFLNGERSLAGLLRCITMFSSVSSSGVTAFFHDSSSGSGGRSLALERPLLVLPLLARLELCCADEPE